MSFEPDDVASKSIDNELQQNILIELKKISRILAEVHDVEITNEDIDNDSN